VRNGSVSARRERHLPLPTIECQIRRRSSVSGYRWNYPDPPRPLPPGIRVILNRSRRGTVRCATRRTVLSEDDRCIGPPSMESITTSALPIRGLIRIGQRRPRATRNDRYGQRAARRTHPPRKMGP